MSVAADRLKMIVEIKGGEFISSFSGIFFRPGFFIPLMVVDVCFCLDLSTVERKALGMEVVQSVG